MIQTRLFVVLLIVLTISAYLLLIIDGTNGDKQIKKSIIASVKENNTESVIVIGNDLDNDGQDNGADEEEEVIVEEREENNNGISSSEEEEKENNDNERSDDDTDLEDQVHEIQSGKVTPLTIDQLMNFNCHEPIGVILGNQYTKKKFPSKIINVGFPKAGSTSILRIFSGSGKLLKNEYKHASHYSCGKVNGTMRPCGVCMNEAMKEGRPLLSSCGDYKVYAQMDHDSTRHGECFFPQMSSLNEIYDEVPDAVFLLSFRNLTSWYDSLNHWGKLRMSLTERCDVPGLPLGIGWDDDDLERWVCGHVQNIRKFVFDHPSITLIEFNLEDVDVGEYLASILPGLDPQFWSKKNVGSYKKKSGRRKLQRYSRFA